MTTPDWQDCTSYSRGAERIPRWWVIRACSLSGKALHVGVVIWYLAGVSKYMTVKLTRSRLRQFNIHHEAGRRGLIALEKAHLVAVKRDGHKSPVVTILQVPTPSELLPGRGGPPINGHQQGW